MAPEGNDIPSARVPGDPLAGADENDDETRIFETPRVRDLGVGDKLGPKGRFELVEELGAGGMGRVFKARDKWKVEAGDPQPYVALKVVGREFQRHPNAFQAFHKEAERARSLAHPNIVRVYDCDKHGPHVFITMEYLSGRSLDKIIKSRPPGTIPLKEALKVLKPVCSALAFAHENGIVHCDIKPSNIFVTDKGVVKVIDFGIARAIKRADAAAGEATVFDLHAFAPAYASPEMHAGDKADPRDDIFSLACVIYKMLSGKRPFGDEGAALAHVKDRRPEKPPGLTGAQWSALKSGFAFSRSERPASVESFLSRLERQPGWKGRLMTATAVMWAAVSRFLARLDPRPAWKNRRWLVAAGGLALALIIGLVWFPPPGPEPTVPTTGNGEKVPPPQQRQEPGPEPTVPTTGNGEKVSPPQQEPLPPEPNLIQDCDECPVMVVIPAGRFTMGAPSTDPDAEPQEKPQREVVIEKDFALGRYEVTEREWQACVEDGVCRTDPPARATDFSDHPRTHVNRWDARRFVRWLNQKTEQNYRLPTEEEWEYAARAGTNTRYPWGDEVGQNNANCKDCGVAMSGQGTAPVDSFAPNAFGLFNMVGNVWEWTAACGKVSADVCTQRIVRGGSWDNSASAVRVTQRNSVGTDIRVDNIGFRVARDISQ